MPVKKKHGHCGTWVLLCDTVTETELETDSETETETETVPWSY